jgi:predicted nucleic-acid-binding protein
MVSLDTNVLVRLLVADDARQAAAAERALATHGTAWISDLVLAETAWVMRDAYGYPRRAIGAAISGLLEQDVFVFADRARVRRAHAQYVGGAADFADCLVLALAADADALPLLTFDTKLAKLEGAQRI